ncbi:MAG TPA: nucleotidyltransferase [Mariniphaga sp.]|nr:nucleotidyltransferase [Mariniphaga sp.]
MNTQPHFEELLRLLEENKVEYVIVGGYAVSFYGYPRFTKDIDILFKNSEDNVLKIKNALIAFGFSSEDLPDSLFYEQGNIIQFGIEPLRVDILNEIDGVGIDEVLSHSVRGTYGEVEINFIGIDELIKNKESTGRDQDKLDAKKLRKRSRE